MLLIRATSGCCGFPLFGTSNVEDYLSCRIDSIPKLISLSISRQTQTLSFSLKGDQTRVLLIENRENQSVLVFFFHTVYTQLVTEDLKFRWSCRYISKIYIPSRHRRNFFCLQSCFTSIKNISCQSFDPQLFPSKYKSWIFSTLCTINCKRGENIFFFISIFCLIYLVL